MSEKADISVEILRAALHALPRLRPNPAWKARTKEHLLRLFDELHTPLGRPRRWAVCATSDDSLAQRFAEEVVAAGDMWRPIVVESPRVAAAMASIQPAVLLVDKHSPTGRLARERRGSCVVLDVSQLPRLQFALAAAA